MESKESNSVKLIYTKLINDQRKLSAELGRRKLGDKSIIQLIENRIQVTKFKDKEDLSHLSQRDEKATEKELFRKNHHDVWNQSRLHSGYNTARKDPAAMMYLSSLYSSSNQD